jgi:hypothetical protein
MKAIQLLGNGSGLYHTGTIWFSTRLVLALYFLIFIATPHLALAAELGQPKNVLVQ